MIGWGISILLLLGIIGGHLWWRRRYHSLALGQATEPAGLTDALRMTDMFTNMPEGVLVTDHKGVIEFANPTFCKLFELADDPKGKTVMEAIRIHQANELVERLREENSVVQEEFMLPNLNERFLQVNGVAIREKQGRHRGAAPAGGGHLLEQGKQQQDVDQMQQHVGQVMAGRSQGEQLNVQLMGDYGQREPA